MPSFSKYDVVLLRYPFSDSSSSKVRPAVIVNNPHSSHDVFVVPLTSQLSNLLSGEFKLNNWREAGLNVPSAVKRGLYTVHEKFVVKSIGKLSEQDIRDLHKAIIKWMQ